LAFDDIGTRGEYSDDGAPCSFVNILKSPERPAVIHGVQHVFHPPNWLPGWPSDDRHSRMLFITRGIPRGWVEALLAALDAKVAAVLGESADIDGDRLTRDEGSLVG
jgi:hypothetical protein